MILGPFEMDQSTIDNPATITFTSIGVGGSSVNITDAGYYPSAVIEHSPSAGAYQRWDAKWSIRASLLLPLGGAKPGDTITDSASKVWTVLQATPPVISGVWQISTLRLAIAPALAMVGTLTRPSNTEQDAAGRQGLTIYATIAADIVCYVEPMDSTAGDTFERRTMTTKLTAYLETMVEAQALDKFTVAEVDYTVLSSTKPDRLDALQELELQLIS
jgi:hypothetical protein